jgi:hypothetical protein
MSALEPKMRALMQWHLQHNHVPPVDRRYLPFAEKAVEMQGSDDKVTIGSQTLHDMRGKVVTARQCCDAWHLWDFVRIVQGDELGLTVEDADDLRARTREITGE